MTQSPDPASQAAKLIETGTDKHVLESGELEKAIEFSKVTPTVKAEVYARRLNQQISGERDRLLAETVELRVECVLLRVMDKELAALKAASARDRWETAMSVLAMGIGTTIIGVFQRGSTDPIWFTTAGTLHGAGWGLVCLAAVWTLGKAGILSLADLVNWNSRKPSR